MIGDDTFGPIVPGLPDFTILLEQANFFVGSFYQYQSFALIAPSRMLKGQSKRFVVGSRQVLLLKLVRSKT